MNGGPGLSFDFLRSTLKLPVLKISLRSTVQPWNSTHQGLMKRRLRLAIENMSSLVNYSYSGTSEIIRNRYEFQYTVIFKYNSSKCMVRPDDDVKGENERNENQVFPAFK